VDAIDLSATAANGWGEQIALDGAPDPLELDLSGLTHHDPLLNLRLAALLDRYEASGCRIEVRTPRSLAVQLQLALMQIDCRSKLLGLPISAEVSGPPNFLPVVRLSVPDQVDRLAEGLQGMLNEHFTGNLRPLAQPLFVAVSELCDNATTHGGNPLGAFVAARRDAAGCCVLAIGDLGIGIPTHIRHALPDPLDDGNAIEQAMRPGVSGAGPERGGGYPGLFAAIQESEAASARLRVWSASGRTAATFRGGSLVHQAGWSGCPHTDGTWVSLELLPASSRP